MRPIITTSAGKHKKKSLVQKVQDHFFIATFELLYLVVSFYEFLKLSYHLLHLRWLNLTFRSKRTPELVSKDVSSLPKIPRHIAAILQLKEDKVGGGLDGLLEESAQLAAWCMGAGIPALTIYERHGVLKALDPQEFQRRISKKLESFYGSAPLPTINVKVPPVPSNAPPLEDADLAITLIAEEDGRQALVDLTRTLGNLALMKKINPNDITISSIDTEMKHIVVGEPDLVIVFGPSLDLQGFPPWQMRLSEIFYLPDNNEVSYPIFLKGLEKYAGCKINVGR